MFWSLNLGLGLAFSSPAPILIVLNRCKNHSIRNKTGIFQRAEQRLNTKTKLFTTGATSASPPLNSELNIHILRGFCHTPPFDYGHTASCPIISCRKKKMTGSLLSRLINNIIQVIFGDLFWRKDPVSVEKTFSTSKYHGKKTLYWNCTPL